MRVNITPAKSQNGNIYNEGALVCRHLLKWQGCHHFVEFGLYCANRDDTSCWKCKEDQDCDYLFPEIPTPVRLHGAFFTLGLPLRTSTVVDPSMYSAGSLESVGGGNGQHKVQLLESEQEDFC